jgi:hypothetical protein
LFGLVVVNDEALVDLSVFGEEVFEIFFGSLVVDVAYKYLAILGLVVRLEDASLGKVRLRVKLKVRFNTQLTLTSRPSISCLEERTRSAADGSSNSKNAKPSGWLVFLLFAKTQDLSLPKVWK